MFSLPFLPDFSGVRRRLLALTEAPAVELPPFVERCLPSKEELEPIELEALKQTGEAGLWRSCFHCVRPILLRCVGAGLFGAVAAAGATLVGMEILKVALPADSLLGLTVAFFAANFVSQVGVFWCDRLRQYVGLVAEAHLARFLAAKLLRISPRARAAHSSGSLKVLITSDARTVGTFFDNFARNLVPALAALAVISPLIVHFAGAAGAAAVVVMLLILPITAWLNHVGLRYQDRTQAATDALASLAGEWVKNIRLIRFLSWGDRIEQDVSESVRSFSRAAIAQHFLACLIFGMGLSWWMVSIASVAWVSKALGTKVEFVPFFGSIWLLTYLSYYINHLPNTLRYYGMARISMGRIAKLLTEEDQSDSFAKPEAPVRLGGSRPVRIRLEAVSARYGPDRAEVLRDLDLTLDLGRKTAVLGEIGAGKSTLLRLLTGELPPSSGRILVEFDDGSLRDLWIEAVYHRVRECLAYVPQEPFVSNDTLEANIALDDACDSPSVMQAVEEAELLADIALLERGLRQEIGENGVNLSGGQKQRLNLARALHSRRPFLLLDDTLSAVDTRTEGLLMERLSRRPGGCVLVTHRVGEILRMERVLTIKDGRVAEDGDPAELASRADSLLNRVLSAYSPNDGEPQEAEATAGEELPS